MAMKTKSNKVGNEFGCGFMERIFNLKSPRLRNSLVHSLPMKGNNIDHVKNEAKLFPNKEPKVPQKISNENRKRSSDATARSSTSSSSGASSTLKRVEQNHNTDDDVKLQIESARNSLQLARISTIRTRDNESNKSVTKDFSPLKLTGNLLVNNTPRRKSVDSLPKHLELNSVSSFYNGNINGRKVVMGNIMRKNSNELAQFLSQRHNIADPEVLKSMGNEAYKKGNFEEALALYDKAIAIDSNKATYHCNKSAALIGLGRFQEAILECEESIRLDPSYIRAHNRLATIYFRLGDVEKALDCNRSTSNVDSVLAFQAQALQNHLKKCIEARKFNEWSVVLKETQSALSLGADSAPQIYALQTEALLKLVRYQEAYAVYDNMPKFPDDWCNKIFGMATSAYLLMISALVYLASGRFEEAVKTSQQAARVDPSNREVNAVLRRAKAVTSSRMSGNLLFKASKFMEACAVYNEGLDHDPHNSVLLCNRAACRSKLGQYEKAIEDCDAALMLNPCYSKARLRRAYCNAKLERWEVAIQDYEMLIREKPGDEEVARALFEARLQIKMLRGEDIKDLKFGSNLVCISSNDRFRHYVTSPGMAVVLFSNKGTHKQVLTVLEETSITFLRKLSIASIAIASVTLISLFLITPDTCVPPETPLKPHFRFPKSTCDFTSSRPSLPSDKKNNRLWSSRDWNNKLRSFSLIFLSIRDIGLLPNNTKVLCISAGAGHEVSALQRLGVEDVTGIELLESLPLVRRADPHDLPFFDGAFDFAFTARFDEALFPTRFAAEMERVVRGGGVCFVLVGECGANEVREVVRLFRNSRFVRSTNVTLSNVRMTSILMRTRKSSS